MHRPDALALLFAVVASAALAAPTQAVTVVGRDVRVAVDAMPNGLAGTNTEHGYVDYRVSVTNMSTTRAHRVTLRLPARSYGHGEHIRAVTRTLAVEPEATQVVSLFQLPMAMQGSGLEVVANGQRKQIDTFSILDHAVGWGHHSSSPPAFVLASRSIDASFRSTAQTKHSSSVQPSVLESQIDADLWSNDWLSYTLYDGVVVTAGDMRAMPADVKRALRRYTEAGGSLTVLGPWPIEADWTTVPRPGSDGNHNYLGFGELTIVPEGDPRKLDADAYQRLSQMWEATSMGRRNIKTVEQANRDYQVIDDLGVPTKGLLLLMIAFAVLIGPVNLWVLAKKRRRMWLLWTVPAVSLLFCGAVWGYAVIAEGWSGREYTEGFTHIDERNATATTLGMTGFYSPLTPGGGLRFERDTELTPQINRRHWNSGRGRTVDWTNEQHLRSGWVVARVPAHFRVRKSDATQRARINPTVVDGKLTAVNGLGADVQSITIADADGNLHEAGATPAGRPFNLTPTGRKAVARSDALRQVYRRDWPMWVVRHLSAPNPTSNRDAYLRANTYIAVMDSNPFIESGLDQEETRRAKAVVYGTYAPAAEE